MKTSKFIIPLFFLTFCFSFGQTEKEFYNSVAYKYENNVDYPKESVKKIVKTTRCLVKKYNYDYKKMNEFKTIKEWENETNLKAKDQTSINGTFSDLMMGYYDIRMDFYNRYSKCLNKEEYDW